jgi:hypothetical protein
MEEYKGSDPLQYVISLNLKRRHLNESQRAVVASRLANMEAHRPSENKSANLRTSQDQASKMLNVSPRTIQTIKRIEREAPQYSPVLML